MLQWVIASLKASAIQLMASQSLGQWTESLPALRQSNPDLRYTNLAQRGLLVGEIREQQLETALRCQARSCQCCCGGQRYHDRAVCRDSWEEAFQTLYEVLTQTGAVVFASNVPEILNLQTLKEPL